MTTAQFPFLSRKISIGSFKNTWSSTRIRLVSTWKHLPSFSFFSFCDRCAHGRLRLHSHVHAFVSFSGYNRLNRKSFPPHSLHSSRLLYTHLLFVLFVQALITCIMQTSCSTASYSCAKCHFNAGHTIHSSM
jgi:hypothetical protein